MQVAILPHLPHKNKKKKKKNQEGQNTQRSLASFPGLHTAVYHTAINEMVGGALRKG